MLHNDLFTAILNGDNTGAEQLAASALGGGADPEELLGAAMIPAMDEVGRRFEDGRFFLPNLLIAARAMKAALALIQPRLTEHGADPVGTVVIGTVAGDQHDIGKNIVAAMLEGSGFSVIDLGFDVGPQAFVDAVRDSGAQIVALSALLTTTMPTMRTIVDALTIAGLRGQVKILVGGAPLGTGFANGIGADAYAETATSAVAMARALLRGDQSIAATRSSPEAAEANTTVETPSTARISGYRDDQHETRRQNESSPVSMTSREIVKRTLDFASPPRLPRNIWMLPWVGQNHPEAVERVQHDFPDDFTSCPGYYETEPPCIGDPYAIGTYRDDWGCTFVNLQKGIIGEVKEPLIAEWSDLGKVHIPNEKLTLDIAKANEFCRKTDKFVLMGRCPRPFERLQFLRGSANLLMDLVDRPPELFELIDQIHQFYCAELRLWAQTDVDALSIMDDWGSQRALLVAPDLWRELFKPLYREYIDIAHSAGKSIFMHSDGYTLDIIPDLIELGLDALNSQIFCMGLQEVGEYAGRITFWGELDRQDLLPNATTDEIAAIARQMVATLHRDGGFIAQCEFGVGADPANVFAYFSELAGPLY